MKRTRRRTIATMGSLLAAGLAGCTNSSDDGSESKSDGTESDSPAESPTGTDGSEGSYTVEMAPVGEVEFDAVPERWSTYFPGYADMGVALGQADGLASIGNGGRYHTQYYDELDGVSVAKADLTVLVGESGIDVELFYETDADVHLTDPQWLVNNGFFGLDEDDVDSVAAEVGPFLGNSIFRRTDEWHDYQYYTLYEAFETVAEVFQERERFEALQSLHDDYVARVREQLPPAEERPNALLCFGNGDEPDEFSPYRLADEGTNKKQFHDLGVHDALADTGIDGLSTSDRGKIDYETIADVDPDVLLVRGHEDKTDEEFRDTVLAYMQDHPVASDLTCVQEERVFRGGPIYQGPIQHLFTLERAATQLFPDTFEGELFDRDEVASVVGGED